MKTTRKNYIFNKKTLTYNEVKPAPGKTLKKALVFLFITVITGSCLFLISANFGSPRSFLLEKKQSYLDKRLGILNKKLDSLSNIIIENNYRNDNMYRIILGLDSLALTMRQAGTGGSQGKSIFGKHSNSVLVLKIAKKIDKIQHQLKIQDTSYAEIENATTDWQKEISSLPLVMPISVKDLLFISSTFGRRIDPIFHIPAQHHGLDYVASLGTKVYATGNGIVTLSKYSRKGYGNEVIIDHSFGFSTRYAHLSEILVKTGDSVKRGQVIGLVGSTGKSTGPHLHYEVRSHNKPVNPFFYYSDDISGDEYEKMVNLNNSKN